MKTIHYFIVLSFAIALFGSACSKKETAPDGGTMSATINGKEWRAAKVRTIVLPDLAIIVTGFAADCTRIEMRLDNYTKINNTQTISTSAGGFPNGIFHYNTDDSNRSDFFLFVSQPTAKINITKHDKPSKTLQGKFDGKLFLDTGVNPDNEKIITLGDFSVVY